ncbi:MAG TPA: helix-turn-helix domain-containing protein [Mycobacteriales bacterium]|nr:helix-turn-helix domain-containing protein [Mycobacteriales bacterium]
MEEIGGDTVWEKRPMSLDTSQRLGDQARLADLPELMTVAEVAVLLRMGTSTAYAAIKRGAFPVPVLRVGGRMLVSRYQLAGWLGVSSHDVATETADTVPSAELSEAGWSSR